jgi:hypothetical protein
MADVFGRSDSPFVGAFSADQSRLFFADQNMAGSLTQNLNVQYNQTVSPLFEIGSSNRYYVVGRTSGNMGLGLIIGPAKFNTAFIQRLGNVCASGSRRVSLELGGGLCQGGSLGGLSAQGGANDVKLTADACVAMGITYGVQSQDVLVNEAIQIMFGQLSRS